MVRVIYDAAIISVSSLHIGLWQSLSCSDVSTSAKGHIDQLFEIVEVGRRHFTDLVYVGRPFLHRRPVCAVLGAIAFARFRWHVQRYVHPDHLLKKLPVLLFFYRYVAVWIIAWPNLSHFDVSLRYGM